MWGGTMQIVTHLTSLVRLSEEKQNVDCNILY